MKGYLLTYLGWFIAIIASAAVTYGLVSIFFGAGLHVLMSDGSIGDGETAFAEIIIGALVLLLFTLVVFQLCMLILSPVAIYFCLRNNQLGRKATILWTDGLLFVLPLISVPILLTGLHPMLDFSMVAAPILLIPYAARFAATRK